MQSEQFELHALLEQRHWWFQGRRRIMRRLALRAVPDADGADRPLAIDVGCGTGANLAALADRFRCLGIDTSPEAIRLARGRFPRVEFRQGYAPQGAEDHFRRARLVLLMDVLEHVPDDFSLLSSLLAASRPGTQFLITVPADMGLWSRHDESFGHWRRYDPDRFARLWRDLPVRVRLCSHFNARLLPLVRWVRRRNRRRGESAGAAGTDFALPAAPLNRGLQWVFGGEARRLAASVDRTAGRPPYRQGVSLVALLERGPGRVPLHGKPGDLPPDPFDPQAGQKNTAGIVG